MKKEPYFATETDLCAYFLAEIGADWVGYSETEGWDILLVRKADGCQIGIQAKLKLNAKVLNQAAEEYHGYRARPAAPDYRAVMVPSDTNTELARIAGYIGLTVITVSRRQGWHGPAFHPYLPKPGGDAHGFDREWHEMMPLERHRLPDYVPDVAAGASAPLQLTRWKVSALKVAVILETRGFVTRADFGHLGIDHRRWIAPQNGWLEPCAEGFKAGQWTPDFKAQHPANFEQIKADAEKWMPPAPLTLGLQQSRVCEQET